MLRLLEVEIEGYQMVVPHGMEEGQGKLSRTKANIVVEHDSLDAPKYGHQSMVLVFWHVFHCKFANATRV